MREYADEYHKTTCHLCGASWYARGQLGSGRQKCQDCKDMEKQRSYRKSAMQREAREQQRNWKIRYDPCGDMTGVLVSSIEIHQGLIYGSWYPYTTLVPVRAFSQSGVSFAAGKSYYVRYTETKARLVDIDDNIIFEHILRVDPMATFEQVCHA